MAVGIALWWPHRRGTLLFIVRGFVTRTMSAGDVAALFDEIPPKARQILDGLEHGGKREVFEERIGPFRVATAFVHDTPSALVVVRRLAGGSWRVECAASVGGVATLSGGDGVGISTPTLAYRYNGTESVDDLMKAHANLGGGTALPHAAYFDARRALYRQAAGRAFRRDILMAALGLGIIAVNVYGLLRVSAYF